MKKKLKILALICALCLAMTMAFTACGSDTASGFDNPSSESSSSSSSAPTDETPEEEGDEESGEEEGGEEEGGEENPDPAPNPETGEGSWTQKNY